MSTVDKNIYTFQYKRQGDTQFLDILLGFNGQPYLYESSSLNNYLLWSSSSEFGYNFTTKRTTLVEDHWAGAASFGVWDGPRIILGARLNNKQIEPTITAATFSGDTNIADNHPLYIKGPVIMPDGPEIKNPTITQGEITWAPVLGFNVDSYNNISSYWTEAKKQLKDYTQTNWTLVGDGWVKENDTVREIILKENNSLVFYKSEKDTETDNWNSFQQVGPRKVYHYVGNIYIKNKNRILHTDGEYYYEHAIIPIDVCLSTKWTNNSWIITYGDSTLNSDGFLKGQTLTRILTKNSSTYPGYYNIISRHIIRLRYSTSPKISYYAEVPDWDHEGRTRWEPMDMDLSNWEIVNTSIQEYAVWIDK